MLYLRTGLPGAGKTLNAIREIDIEHQPDPENPLVRLYKDSEHPDLEPRTIYFYGIPDVKTDKLKSNWVEFDHPETWFDLPDGSVVVIDEAQKILGADGTRGRPEKITRFETHRHQGLDIHLITQHPSLLAPAVRKLVGKHINFIRPYGREKGIFRHEYEFCIDSPEKRSYFQQAQEEKVKLDPEYFGTYKSSTIHTHKPITPNYIKKIPLYIGLTLIPIAILVLLGFFMADKYGPGDSSTAEASGLPVSTQTVGNVVQPVAPPVSAKDSYIDSMKPRIEGVPHSAPRYDGVAKPMDFPRLVCAASFDSSVVERNRSRGHPIGYDDAKPYSCTCYTQQVTRVDTTASFCLDIVRNGMFDDTRRPSRFASGSDNGLTSSANRAGFERGPAARSAPDSTTSRVTVIDDSGYASRPWR